MHAYDHTRGSSGVSSGVVQMQNMSIRKENDTIESMVEQIKRLVRFPKNQTVVGSATRV